MLTAGQFLSVLSVIMTVVAINSWRIHFLPWGFEGTGYVALLSLAVGVTAAISAIVIAVARARSRMMEGLFGVLLPSGTSLVALVMLVIACPGGC